MYCPGCNVSHQPLYCPNLAWPQSMSEAKDMIDPVSQPEQASTTMFPVSAYGYHRMRTVENRIIEEEFVSFDDVVWC